MIADNITADEEDKEEKKVNNNNSKETERSMKKTQKIKESPKNENEMENFNYVEKTPLKRIGCRRKKRLKRMKKY